MPYPDQTTEIAPEVRTYFVVTIQYKYHAAATGRFWAQAQKLVAFNDKQERAAFWGSGEGKLSVSVCLEGMNGRWGMIFWVPDKLPQIYTVIVYYCIGKVA